MTRSKRRTYRSLSIKGNIGDQNYEFQPTT